ncbi:hypothetical protein FA15DRAFT_651790 [Coprinopsis marcescibilis]|uniref:Uncharacterized protein n=1 Tax=Coprinopsis marcescibilis TaxID=230819 RepID=A0A5C3LB76_COPMA|nr:hypothetical protein FA15DRAFT_651790 [Coprinopsis marcescibilis]
MQRKATSTRALDVGDYDYAEKNWPSLGRFGNREKNNKKKTAGGVTLYIHTAQQWQRYDNNCIAHLPQAQRAALSRLKKSPDIKYWRASRSGVGDEWVACQVTVIREGMLGSRFVCVLTGQAGLGSDEDPDPPAQIHVSIFEEISTYTPQAEKKGTPANNFNFLAEGQGRRRKTRNLRSHQAYAPLPNVAVRRRTNLLLGMSPTSGHPPVPAKSNSLYKTNRLCQAEPRPSPRRAFAPVPTIKGCRTTGIWNLGYPVERRAHVAVDRAARERRAAWKHRHVPRYSADLQTKTRGIASWQTPLEPLSNAWTARKRVRLQDGFGDEDGRIPTGVTATPDTHSQLLVGSVQWKVAPQRVGDGSSAWQRFQ